MQLGKIGRAAVPHLIELLKDDDPRIRLDGVKGIGPAGPLAKDAVPLLIELIHDDRLGSAPINALAAIGPGAKAAIPHLLKELKSESVGTRRLAAIALGRIDREGQTVPVLIDLLDEDWFSVAGAVEGLGYMGPNAEAAVPALMKTLGHKSVLIRYYSAWTLGNIGPAAKAAIPALRRALEDKLTEKRTGSYFEEVPRAAAEALKEIGG